MVHEHPAIYDSSARLTEEERKIILLGLKVLFADVQLARVMGYPVEPTAIKVLVAKLGGRPELL